MAASDTVAFIPVRGGSKSIPAKNIRLLAGRPLVHWVTQAALECELIDRVFVASDCPRIREIAGQIAHPRLEVIDRSPHTASDQASTESALLEFAERFVFDRVVLIQATSPLLGSQDLHEALTRMRETDATSVLSVTRQRVFRWRQVGACVEADNYDPQKRPRRQDWEGELHENGAFYATSREALLASGCRISGRTLAHEMSLETALELDEPADWAYAEHLLSSPVATATRGLNSLPRLLVSDCDGVLTDAGMYYGPQGEALKKFNTRDGMGIRRWRERGREIAIMTGENSPIVSERAKKLGINRVFLGVQDKLSCLQSLCQELGLHLDEVAYIGDDINDLEAMRAAGVTACPADAQPRIVATADFRCERRGGEGCVREFIDHMLAHALEIRAEAA